MRYHLIEHHRPKSCKDKPCRWPDHVLACFYPRLGQWWACWVDIRGHRIGPAQYGVTQAEARSLLPAKDDAVVRI